MGTPKPESISRLRVILLLCRNRWYCKIFSEFLENQLDGIVRFSWSSWKINSMAFYIKIQPLR
uniref:Uncharacterized protein n=1 Tax=Solanum lycopersicum TaxID=4081 RepID=A0A3Q7F948_SOLLC